MPYTLLLADDSVTIQRVIELTFADEDVQVSAVSDGDEAIARVDAHPPDIVLADVGMPGKSGYEIARHIKHTPRLAHIPVLLLTGAFEPVDQRKAAEAGSDGVLAKPFEPQLVIARVRELLERARDGSAAPPLAPAPAVVPQPPPAPPVAPPPAHVETTEDYFHQLDAALNPPAPAVRPAPVEREVRPAPPVVREAVVQEAWSISPEPEVPLSYASPQASFESPAVPVIESRAVPVIESRTVPVIERPAAPAVPPTVIRPAAPEKPPAPVAPPAPRPAPVPAPERQPASAALADAFAALLAAEQQVAPGAPAPRMPTSQPITEDAIERIVQRVIERLTDQVVRDTVADVVARVAERLVREEINRIKASIK